MHPKADASVPASLKSNALYDVYPVSAHMFEIRCFHARACAINRVIMVRFKWKKSSTWLTKVPQPQVPLNSGAPFAWKTSTTKPSLMLASISSFTLL